MFSLKRVIEVSGVTSLALGNKGAQSILSKVNTSLRSKFCDSFLYVTGILKGKDLTTPSIFPGFITGSLLKIFNAACSNIELAVFNASESVNSTPTIEDLANSLSTFPLISISKNTLTTDCNPNSLALSGKTKYFSICSAIVSLKQIL